MAKAAQKEITAEEAAKLLKISPRTVRNMIAKKNLKGRKVGGRWFVEKSSIFAMEHQAEPAKPRKTASAKGLRQLAAYRLFEHVCQNFTWEHPNSRVAALLEEQRLKVISELGAGYYSYGKYKNQCYIEARYSLGAMLAVLEAFPDDGLTKAREFIELECLPALGSLIKKIETL